MILLSPSRSILGPTLSCFAPSPRCRPNIADHDPPDQDFAEISGELPALAPGQTCAGGDVSLKSSARTSCGPSMCIHP
jgi:hypothetical protein